MQHSRFLLAYRLDVSEGVSFCVDTVLTMNEETEAEFMNDGGDSAAAFPTADQTLDFGWEDTRPLTGRRRAILKERKGNSKPGTFGGWFFTNACALQNLAGRSDLEKSSSFCCLGPLLSFAAFLACRIMNGPKRRGRLHFCDGTIQNTPSVEPVPCFQTACCVAIMLTRCSVHTTHDLVLLATVCFLLFRCCKWYPGNNEATQRGGSG